MILLKVFFIVLLFIVGAQAHAGAIVNYNGRVLKPDGKPLEESSVSFTISIYSPLPEKCLLYQEKQVVDMTGSGGLFSVAVGDGKGVKTAADPAIAMDLLFTNNVGFSFKKSQYPKLACDQGTEYQPQLLDTRLVSVSFNDGKGSGDQTLPANEVSFVPMSLNANNSQKFNGLGVDKFLRVDTASAIDPLTVTEYNNLKSNSAVVARVTTLETKMDEKASLNGATFYAAISAPAYLYISDQKLKTNVQTYNDGLNSVLKLRGVTFDWKSTGQSEVGLIAQEVEKVEPRLIVDIKKDNGEQFKAVKYGNIVAMLIEAVKGLFERTEHRNAEVDKQIRELKEEIKALHKEVKELSAQSCKQK